MNKIRVKGISNLTANPTEFVGSIVFDKRNDGYYFVWNLSSVTGEFLGSKRDFISDRIIPENYDTNKFILDYAIESIRKYRINRKKFLKFWNIS
jgi:hypothetical protein